MKKIRNIGLTDFEIINGIMYFCDIFTGNIVALDLFTATFSILYLSADDKKMQYTIVKRFGDFLYFFPGNAVNVLKLNYRSNKINFIKINEANTSNKPLFIDVVNAGNIICLIPGRYHSIVMLNDKTNTVEYLKIKKNEEDMFTNCKVVMKNSTAYIFNKLKGQIYLFDIGNRHRADIKLNIYEFKPLCVVNIGKKIFWAGFGEGILSYDIQEQKKEWIENYFNCEKPTEGFCYMIEFENTIYMVAINQPLIYKLSLENMNISLFIEFEWGEQNIENWNMFTKCDILSAKIVNNLLILYSTLRQSIISINLYTKEIIYYQEFCLGNGNIVIKEKVDKNQIIQEGEVSLENYIEYLI